MAFQCHYIFIPRRDYKAVPDTGDFSTHNFVSLGYEIVKNVVEGIPAHIRDVGDKQCMPRAFALAKLFADKDTAASQLETNRIKAEIRRVKRRDRNRDYGLQLARMVLQEAGVTYNDQGYDLTTFKKIAASLSNYKIYLYARLPGEQLYTQFIEVINPDAPQIMTLGFHDSHYDYFQVNRRGTGRTLCKVCRATYTNVRAHRCEFKCRKCHQRLFVTRI